MDYTGTWEARVTSTISKISGDDARVIPAQTLPLEASQVIADGAGGDNQADSFYASSGNLGPAAILDINLLGVLTDIFGDAWAPAEIKMIFIKNTTTTAVGAILHLGGDPSILNIEWIGWCSVAGSIIVIPPTGWVQLAAPDAAAWAVPLGVGAGDNLALENQDAIETATYEIVLVGTT